VTRDGTAIAEGDPTWDVSIAGGTSSDGQFTAIWDVDAKATHGSYVDMGAAETAHQWSVTVNFGTHVPRVTDSYGDQLTITRSANGDGTYDVTTTGYPVTQGVNDECDVSTAVWSCPVTAGQNVTNFQTEIGDFQQWSDSSQWNDFYGMDSWTNVEETAIPPSITGDPLQVSIQLANSHFLNGSTTPFRGFYHIVLPNKFLKDMGIDDPSTLDPAGVSTSVGTGSGSVSVSPGPSSTQVDATGLTFSPRVLRVKRGVITPTRPSHLTAHRVSAHRGKLSFHRARPRGSKLRFYQARCAASHHATRFAKGRHTRLVVKGLAAHKAYRCQVRAKAKAGYGHWSKKRKLRA
jgi:hypothetical protein